MTFSTTSSSQKSYKYDVFLSFRGDDVRKNFVDNLFDALQRKNIYTFKDDERLQKGRGLGDQLMKSIEESKLYIVVYSKNYESAYWCLTELKKIMKCQNSTERIAYRVLCDMDKSEVCKELGSHGEAFVNLPGWDLRKTSDGHETKTIKEIVETISLQLSSTELKVDERLVGMESRIDDVLSSLETDVEDVRMIGIKGIGGGGKTTLARAVFDKICVLFQATSIVDNIREVSTPSMSGLTSLQERILSDLSNGKHIAIGSVHEGKRVIRTRMHGQKILLLLDDIDHLDQLDALAGGLDWFKSGSRIIITTRDEQVLISHGVKFIHDVSLLSDGEAMCLFNRYAFGGDIPLEEYNELSLKVVDYAAGLPLTIKVLGSFLCHEDMPVWIDTIQRLPDNPLKETLESLEISYTTLENDYKEIFLDIACLLKGWLKEDAIRALESCRFHAKNGLKVLEQKSLITVSHDERLGMHKHMKELGQYIVRSSRPDEPFTHSRLWTGGQIEGALANNDLVAKVTGVKFKEFLYDRAFPWCDKDNLSHIFRKKGFGNMKKLRILHVVSFPHYLSKVGQKFPNSLRFLSWVGYPHCYLPKTFKPDQLVALELRHSRIKKLWEEGQSKVLDNLRFLDFSYSDLMTLDCGLLPKLEKLKLEGCDNLVNLHVPTSSRCLIGLVYLNLNGCRGIQESLLFIKELKSLQVLDLSDLHLTELPDILQGCKYSLLEFKFSKNNIKELPSSIGELKKLVSLDTSWCKNLKGLPPSICSLQCLKNLNVENCAIKELPKDLGHLKSLEWLNLRGTPISHPPKSISLLKGLKIVGLTSGDSSVYTSVSSASIDNSSALRKSTQIERILVLMEKNHKLHTHDISFQESTSQGVRVICDCGVE